MKNEKEEVKRSISEQVGEKLVKDVNQGIEVMPISVRFEEAPAPLSLHEETPLKFTGVLNSPSQWLKKRLEGLNQLSSYVSVDRENLKIELVTEERSHFKNSIIGKLEVHPIFTTFGINSGRYISPLEMADLIKMNRYYFQNKTEAMVLVSTMKNFKAKVDGAIESSTNNNGSRTELRSQIVNSNLPESFVMVIPIFKGQPAFELEVEIVVNPEDLKCSLVSPQANELKEKARDEAINEVLADITTLAPDIVVFEK